MKKNIMLLIVSILGVAKISAFPGLTVTVNQPALVCFANQASSQFSTYFTSCGSEVQTIIQNPNNINLMALAQSVANDPNCWPQAAKGYSTYATACSSSGNLVSFS